MNGCKNSIGMHPQIKPTSVKGRFLWIIGVVVFGCESTVSFSLDDKFRLTETGIDRAEVDSFARS